METPIKYNDREIVVKVSTPCPQSIVKDHPFIKGMKYIPIGVIEGMLDRIFGIGNWWVEIKDTKMMVNSVVVVVTLNVDYGNGKIRKYEGVGAAPLQVDAGHKPTDIDALKPNAVMIGLPAAKSFALKDAAEHIGEIFGRNLNRKDFLPSMRQENKVEVKNVEIKNNQ